MGATLKELETILGGGITIGKKIKALELLWKTAWSSRYHTDYTFNYRVEGPHLKFLAQNFTQEDLQVRALNYIRNDDKFYADRRHPFTLFRSQINAFAPAGTSPDLQLEAPTVGDCKHEPRCKSDQEHTRRKMAEAREIR